jgi:hypothetical protein
MKVAEGDVLALLRDGQANGDVDQPKIDGTVPDRSHCRLTKPTGRPSKFSLFGRFPPRPPFCYAGNGVST